MSDRGVFAVDRSIWEHDLLSDNEPFSRREAWLWLVSEAAWKPYRRRVAGRIFDLQRAQLVASLRFIAGKWRWSEARVRRFLDALKTDAMIDATSDAGVTVITICKYDEYQRVSLPTDAICDAKTVERPTQERRKEEDIKNIEDKRTDIGAVADATLTAAINLVVAPRAFEEFWKAYPKRKGANPREPARKAFVAALKAGADPEAIVSAVSRYGGELQAQNQIGTQFVARAVTWLEERRWGDYPQPETLPPPPGFYAPAESEELAAWDAYAQASRGRANPRDKLGGWRFPARWPPDHPRMAMAAQEGVREMSSSRSNVFAIACHGGREPTESGQPFP